MKNLRMFVLGGVVRLLFKMSAGYVTCVKGMCNEHGMKMVWRCWEIGMVTVRCVDKSCNLFHMKHYFEWVIWFYVQVKVLFCFV